MTPFVLLLTLAQPAQALELQSARSESTYGLFRDPFDYVVEPGLMARQEGHQLYTQLSSENSGGRFGLGYQGRSGSAAFGIIGDGAFTGTTEGDTVTDSTGSQTTDGWTKAGDWSLLAGAALAVSDSLSFGAALRLDSDTFSETIDPTTLGYGPDRTLTADGERVFDSHGTLETVTGNTLVLVGAALGAEKTWVEVDAFFNHTANTRDFAGRVETVKGKITNTLTINGFDVSDPLGSNNTTSGPGLKLDSQIRIKKALDLRLAGSLLAASGSAATTRFSSKLDDGTNSLEAIDALSSSEVKATVTNLLAVLEYGGDDLKLRMGFSATFAPISLAWDESYDPGVPKAQVQAWFESEDVTLREYAVPIAAELPVHDRWILRSAARFSSYTTGVETSRIDHLTDDENLTTDTSQSLSGTVVDAALGFRFKATPLFRLDAGISGQSSCTAQGCTGSAGLLDTTALFASGTVHW
jgi:hypothetical protein